LFSSGSVTLTEKHVLSCKVCGSTSLYLCIACGKPICPAHTRLALICNSCIKKTQGEFSIRNARETDKSEIHDLVRLFWGEPTQVAFDREFVIEESPAFVAEFHGHLIGFLSYTLLNEDFIILALAVLPQHQGIGVGKALLETAEREARKLSKRRVLVATSNDNLPALAFYQRHGFQIFDVKTNVIAEKHGAAFPGVGGIPVRDELRLQKIL